MKDLLKTVAERTLPKPVQKWLGTQWHSYQYNPPLGKVRLGDLRRRMPISQHYGQDRGLPIDRYYIEKFLSDRSLDIQGRVLEIGDNIYTRQFGNDYVIHSDVLHIVEGNPKATIVGDLASADQIPPDTFDCIILTQTLQFIYDVRAAIKTIYSILKPGGVVLVTVPGISQRSHDEWSDNWCWGFTTVSTRRLFEETFPAADITLDTHGNVLAAIAFLQGLATQELRREELDHCDPNYEILITVRAMKPVVTQ